MRIFARKGAVLLAITLGSFFVAPVHGATPVVVGTCRPTIASYPTIQEAVNAVSAGGLVLVCAGTYNEQVTIQQPLTLNGIQVGQQQSPVIAPPVNGYTPFTTPLGIDAFFSILVQNAGTVALNNIVVQGNGGCTNPYDTMGIASIDSTTTITNSVLRSIGSPTAFCGTAVYSEGAGNLNMVNVIEHDFFSAVVSYSSQAINISSSTFINGATSLDLETSSGLVTVSGNMLERIGCPQCGAGGAGILITGLIAGSKFTNNSIAMLSSTDTAMALYNSPQLTISGNKTYGGLYAINANGLSGSAIQSNTITDAGVGIKIADNGSGANSFIKNNIKESVCGIWTASSLGDSISGNVFSNASSTICH